MLGVDGPLDRDGNAPSAVEKATQRGRWVCRWVGWADWPLTRGIVAWAAAVLVLDVAAVWAGVSLTTAGRVALSPALLPGVVLGGWLAVRRSHPRGAGAAWREYAVGVGAVLVFMTVGYAATTGGPREAVALVLAALAEELVFRVAALIVLGALCARALGREWRDPRQWGLAPGLCALVGGAALFSLLPGHVEQISGPMAAVSFASLSLVLGYTVLRTGAVWPAVLAHGLLNVTTIAVWSGVAPGSLRLALAATTLVALVGAADLAGRRLGLRRMVPTVIDLPAAAPSPAAWLPRHDVVSTRPRHTSARSGRLF